MKGTSKTLKMKIREMIIDDLPAVYSIGNSVFRREEYVFLYRTWDAYEITGLFSTSPELCLVAEYNKEVIGFALGSTIEKPKSAWKYRYLIWTAVKSDFQGHNVGKKLFLRLEKRMQSQGARMIIIDTEGTNARAINFFGKLGFTKGSQHLWMTKVSGEPKKKKRSIEKNDS